MTALEGAKIFTVRSWKIKLAWSHWLNLDNDWDILYSEVILQSYLQGIKLDDIKEAGHGEEIELFQELGILLDTEADVFTEIDTNQGKKRYAILSNYEVCWRVWLTFLMHMEIFYGFILSEYLLEPR